MPKPKLAVVSLGCDKNRCDTEYLMSVMSDLCEFVPAAQAEYVLINSCAFLKSARQELYSVLQDFRPKQKIILAGCFERFVNKQFLKDFPNVISILKSEEYPAWRQIFAGLTSQAQRGKPRPVFLTPPAYAYLKIAEGCNNRCTFCIIPKLKGAYRSLPIKEILKNAQLKLKRGVSELILVAQDVGYYGRDRKLKLTDLLRELEKLRGLRSIRLLYLYPERITRELLLYIKESKKVLPYFDLPIQHASNTVLRRMGRPYNRAYLEELISTIREIIPGAVLRSTVIVGFPGETEADFRSLRKFLQRQQFNHIGVFGYSDEEWCAAHKLRGKLSARTISARKRAVLQLQGKLSRAYLQQFKGTKQVVLIDGPSKPGVYLGRNYYFTPEVDGVIFVESRRKLAPGQLVQVKILEAGDYDLLGRVLA